MIQSTLRQLEYAVAVADHLHFRRAAEACHVSQPALSNQIAELENRLGCQLFDRSAGGVVVTQSGGKLLSRARRVLEEAAALEHEARHLSQPFSGTLRLGIIPTVAPYLLPNLIPALSREYPNFDLVVHEEQTQVLLRRLKLGEADLLFLALPIDSDGILCRGLFQENFVLAVPESHELAGRREVGVEELRSQAVLLLDDGHCFRDHALEVCHIAGAIERTDVRAAHLGTLVELVRAGLGVTLLPQTSLAILQPRLDDVRILHFTDPVPARRLGLAWRRASGSSAEHEAIGQTLRAALGQLPGLRPVSEATADG